LAGQGWFRSGHPQRFRATYRRLQGTEQFLGFYDVHQDCFVGQVRKRKRVKDLLAAFARLRSCYPLSVRLYVVMDNLNTHKHAELKAFMAQHNIEPVYTPTYASWLNAIEAHFGPLKRFAIAGTDDPSHEYRRWRIARYLTWRNREKGSHKAALAQFRRVKLYRH
jgi:transposase